MNRNEQVNRRKVQPLAQCNYLTVHRIEPFRSSFLVQEKRTCQIIKETFSKIVVDLTTLRQASAGTVDEVASPQPAKCLVASYVVVALQPGKQFREVLRTLVV